MQTQSAFDTVGRGITEVIPRRPVPYRVWKRGFDLAVASILLVLLLPVFVLIAIVVKATSRGSVFYASKRVGRCGKQFRFLKFRTMYQDADQHLAELKDANEKDGPIFKMKNDPRTTPVGKFLRKYSLDELPQLIHVVRGDMSMVGPRPPVPHEVEQYDEFARQRLTIKPGMTCYWQIQGRSNLTFDEWMQLDNKYIHEMSFWTDVKILAQTPLVVFRGDGAY
ncbi:MAG TPA: sugar transferase [Fimbriimonadaceae bacterium]|nr:sugar transferase [Fimbriimonadaceae bacterium]